MAANESIPGSSRMILGGQLGSFHSQLFYPAGPLMSPDRTLASGSMTALHSGIGVQQARDITADFQSGGLHWFTPQDEVRMQYMRNLLDNNERRGYFQICGTQSHPPNSVQVSPTDARDVEGGLLMAKEPWSRTVDNPNNGLRGEQFNVPQMMHDRMMHMAMMPNPTVVSEGPSAVMARVTPWDARHPTPGFDRPQTDASLRATVFGVQREVPWPKAGMNTLTVGGVPFTPGLHVSPGSAAKAASTALSGNLRGQPGPGRGRKRGPHWLRHGPLPAARGIYDPVTREFHAGPESGVNPDTLEIVPGYVHPRAVDANRVMAMQNPDNIVDPRNPLSGAGHPHEIGAGWRSTLRQGQAKCGGSGGDRAKLIGDADGRVIGGARKAPSTEEAEKLVAKSKGAHDAAQSEGMIKAHQERHTNLRYGEVNEPAKRPLSDADAAQTETTASAGGPSAAPADFMADQAAQRNETMARVRDAEVAAQAPLDVSSEAVRRFHAEHLDPADTELMERLLRPSRMFRSGTPGNYQMPPFTALGEQARARELVGGGKGMVGGAWWDALDPNQNGVAAAFNSAGAAIKNEFENPQSKLRNEFENPQSKLRGEILPAVGNEFTNSKSVLRKDILPIASKGLNAAAQIVPQLGPLAGVVGVAQAANEAGAWWDEHVAPTATGVAINNELTNPKSTLRSEVIPALTSTTPVSVLLMNQLTDPKSTLRSKTIPAIMDPKSDLRTKHLPVGAAALNVVAGTLPELGPVAKVLNTAQDVSETAAMFGFGKSGGAHHAYPPSLLKLLHEKAEKAARKERKRKRHAEKEKDFPSGLA